MRTVATAGHVDHGKSSLVLALTGTDPDRFAEEKARGLTIDLGFAFTTLPSGTEVGFVDVPGHARFIKNMLAGVGAVDVAVVVVAAGEGWMPQSEEHLQILEVLGVTHCLVVVTKADTVPADVLDLVVAEVGERLTASSLRSSPVVVCDAVSGRGLDDVRVGLDAVLAAADPTPDRARPRMWIDRVFAARGAGTVVTGTLTGGALGIDDELEVVRPGTRVRVRGIEAAGRHLDFVEPGGRVAVNLAGITHHQLTRGDAIVRPGQWSHTTSIDVAMVPLGDTEVSGRAPLHAYVGSGEHAVRLRRLGPDGRFARLRFEASVPLPLVPGDRLVLRDPGRALTVAGAVVLDAQPATKAADAPASLALGLGPRLVRSRGWIARRDLARLAGIGEGEVESLAESIVSDGAAVDLGEWLVTPELLATVRTSAVARVRDHHRERPLERGIEVGVLASMLKVDPERLRAALAGEPELALEQGIVRDAQRRARAADSDAGRALIAALDATPFSPATPSDTQLARALVREGALVDLDGILFTATAVDRARAVVTAAVTVSGELSVADAREALGTSRKFAIPLLSHFDAEGVTRRRGDVRIAGPRATPS